LSLCFSFGVGSGKCSFDIQEKLVEFSIVLVYVVEDTIEECFFPSLGRSFIHKGENIDDLLLVGVVRLVVKREVHLCILYEGNEIIPVSVKDFRWVDSEFFFGHGFFLGRWFDRWFDRWLDWWFGGGLDRWFASSYSFCLWLCAHRLWRCFLF